jgi:hypothetical protein
VLQSVTPVTIIGGEPESGVDDDPRYLPASVPVPRDRSN